MIPKIKVLTILLLLLLSLSAMGQEVRLPICPPALQRSLWGLCIQDVESGQTLVDINSHLLFTPASTMKVVTTATALSLLSHDQRFTTELWAVGEVREGVLYGDLLLVGSGDPTMGSRHLRGESDTIPFFATVATALVHRGIGRVQGSVKALTLPERDAQGLNPRWLHYDMGNHYGGGSYDLNLIDNSYSLHFYQQGQRYYTQPPIPGLSLERGYVISSRMGSDSLYIAVPTYGDASRRVITGVYPAHRQGLTIRGDIPYPPLFFAQHLQHYLQQRVAFTEGAGLLTERPMGEQTLVATHHSPPLIEIARLTNFHSINHYAEALLRSLAPPTPELEGHNLAQSAIHRTQLYWQRRGLPPDESAIYDGSGLSPENKLSPYYLATLLGKVYRSDPQHRFMETLPMAGVEGSVASFLKGTPLARLARLKSGTIKHAVAYAGYVTLPSGKVYAVAVMVNGFTSRYAEVRKGVEALLLSAFSLTT